MAAEDFTLAAGRRTVWTPKVCNIMALRSQREPQRLFFWHTMTVQVSSRTSKFRRKASWTRQIWPLYPLQPLSASSVQQLRFAAPSRKSMQYIKLLPPNCTSSDAVATMPCGQSRCNSKTAHAISQGQPYRSKVLKCEVCRNFRLGTLVLVWGTDTLYLGTWTLRVRSVEIDSRQKGARRNPTPKCTSLPKPQLSKVDPMVPLFGPLIRTPYKPVTTPFQSTPNRGPYFRPVQQKGIPGPWGGPIGKPLETAEFLYGCCHKSGPRNRPQRIIILIIRTPTKRIPPQFIETVIFQLQPQDRAARSLRSQYAK